METSLPEPGAYRIDESFDGESDAAPVMDVCALSDQTIPSLVLSQIDRQNRQFFYNNAGFTHLIDDSVAIVLGPSLVGGSFVTDASAATTPDWVDLIGSADREVLSSAR